VSNASWEASSRKESLLSVLKHPAYQIALALAAILFCLGMYGLVSSFPEVVLWLLMAVGFASYAVYLVFQVRSKG